VVIDCDAKDIHTPSELGIVLGMTETFDNNMCWTKGNTKGFHIYVKKPENWQRNWQGTNVLGNEWPPIDVIYDAKNVWEREDKIIYNEPKDFNFEAFVSLYIKKRKEPEPEAEASSSGVEVIYKGPIENPNYRESAHCEYIVAVGLKMNLFERVRSDYDSWLRIAYVLVNEGVYNLSGYWLKICKQMPDKHCSSDQDKIDQLKAVIKSVQENPTARRCKTGTLMEMLNSVMEQEDKRDFDDWMKILKLQAFEYKYIKPGFDIDHFQYRGRIVKIFPDEGLYVYKHADAQEQYAHLNWLGSSGVVRFLKRYVEDPEKRMIEKIIMRPDLPRVLDPEEYPKTYNTFSGYQVEKYGNIHEPLDDAENYDSPILHTIFYYLCNRDEDAYWYVIQWFAHLIFAPHEMNRFHTCLVFYSQTEGVGKSFILQDLFYRRIMGTLYGVKTSKFAELWGEFNDMIENKVYVLLEEGSRKDAVSFVDVMKDNLVSSDIVIHKKGMNKYTTNNYVHVCCATNNDTVFTVGKTNRRYAIIQCREEKMIVEMQEELKAELRDDTKVLNFVRFLKSKYNAEWNSEDYILNEQSNKEIWKAQLHLQMSQTDQFLLLTYEELGTGDDRYGVPYMLEVTAVELYKLFRIVMENAGRKAEGIITHTRFGRELHKIGITQNGSRRYQLDDKWVKEYLIKQQLLNE
jgi:hypothetical protein